MSGYLPDFGKSVNTQPGFPPRCTALVPRATKSQSIMWTATLKWELEELGDVTIPSRFSREFALLALKNQGPAYSAKFEHNQKVEASLNIIVGGASDGIPVLEKVPATVRSSQLRVMEGVVEYRVILRIELPVSESNDIVTLLDSDVHLNTYMQDGLPFAPKDNGTGADGDDEDGGAGQTPATKRARRREQATA